MALALVAAIVYVVAVAVWAHYTVKRQVTRAALLARLARYSVASMVLLAVGCTSVPLAPTAVVATAYTCSTQPRVYCAASGAPCQLEVDTYTQTVPCPAVPIK